MQRHMCCTLAFPSRIACCGIMPLHHSGLLQANRCLCRQLTEMRPRGRTREFRSRLNVLYFVSPTLTAFPWCMGFEVEPTVDLPLDPTFCLVFVQPQKPTYVLSLSVACLFCCVLSDLTPFLVQHSRWFSLFSRPPGPQ